MSCLSGSVVRDGDSLATVELVSGVSAVIEHSMGADITLYPMNGTAAALSPVNDAGIDISGGSSSEIDLTKIGGAEAGLSVVGSSSMAIERRGRMVASLFLEVTLDAVFSWATDIAATLEQVCSVNVTVPYLEIEPQIVWVVDGWTANDVLSNTHWGID